MDNFGDKDVSSNARHTDEMRVRGYYYVSSNIQMNNRWAYSDSNGSTSGSSAPISSLPYSSSLGNNSYVNFTYNGSVRVSYGGGSGNYTFTLTSVPSGYKFLGWFYYYNVGYSGSSRGQYWSNDEWELDLLTTSTTWSGSSFGYDYSYGESDADEWEYEYLIPLVGTSNVTITDLASYTVNIYRTQGISDITNPATSWNLTDKAGNDGKQITVNSGTSQTISVSLSSGYTFARWVNSSGASLSTSSSYTFTVTSSITLYAIAIPNRSVITANANGGTLTSPTNVVDNLNVYHVSGYNFSPNSNGWWESQNKNMANSYALCRVYFRAANSGTSLTFRVINYAESTYDFGIFSNLDATLTNSYVTDTSNVYWSGSGKQLATEQTITYSNISAGYHNIYIKYRKDGSADQNNDSLQFFIEPTWSTGTSSQTKYLHYGINYGNLPTPTRNGYTFSGWYTSSSGGSQVTSGTKMPASSTTIYAHWTENTYMIDVNIMSPNGVQDYSSGTMTYTNSSWTTQYSCTDQPYDYMKSSGYIKISDISPAGGMHLSRVTCNHGTISQSGNTYTYTTNLTSAPSGSWDDEINIYMAWNTYTVRYYYWGTSGDTYLSQSCTYGTSYNFYSSASFSFNGSSYGWQTNWVGWATSTSSASVYYSQGSTFSNLTTTNGGVVSLYAILQRTVYVVYNGNGSTSGSTASSSATQYGNLYGTKALSSVDVSAAQNGFTRTGYNFANWRTGTSSGTTYNPGASLSLWSSYNVSATQNLYANWSIISHTVTIYPYVSNTGLSYVAGVPSNYTVTLSGGTGSSASVTMTGSSTKTLAASSLTGYNVTVNNQFNPNEWELMGLYTYQTTPTAIQINKTARVSDSEDTNVYIYFARSSANKLKYTTDNGGYFYFEDGVFPQTKVTGVATSGSASGRTYMLAGRSYSGYIVSGQEYVCVNNTVFKVEPIRWRVSDYGVSSTSYPSGFNKFGTFKSNFTAVSDKVLSVGSAMTEEQYENATWNNWSMTSSLLPSYASGVAVSYAKSSTQSYDKFGGIGSTSVVSGTSTGTSSNVRIASKTDLTSSGLTNYDGRASDLVKYLLSCGTYADYWTTNLGTQYGAGQLMTTGNQTKDNWLYENAGVRFAITFNEGVTQMGSSNTYGVVVKGLYDSALVRVYNNNETVLKATYTSISNGKISFTVGYDDVIVISNLTRSNYINQNLYITGSTNSSYSGTVSSYKLKQLNNNNSRVEIEAQWIRNNLASNYYDSLSFSYDHENLTVSILAANVNISGDIVIPDVVTHPTNGKQYTITKVKREGFINCTKITSVTLPDTILEINSYAFSGCTGLKQIKLSNSLQKIDGGAFDNCRSLTSITLPASIRSVGNSFYECTSLTRTYYAGTLAQWVAVSFSDNTPIKYSKNLYINNSPITSVNLASSNVSSISSYAFYNLPLVSLSLPNTVRSIGGHTFEGCGNMVGSFSTSITSVGDYAFYNCKKLTGTVGALSSIGNHAFENCEGLTSVTISNNLTHVGSRAFEGCSNLKTTNYTGTLARWASIINFDSQASNPIAYSKNLYINGSAVTNIDLSSSGITTIKDHAFFNLTTATNLSLPSTLKTIGDAAFKHCAKLTGSFTIPDSVTSIGESAFSHTGFTSITMGSGVKRIESKTFYECYNLTYLKISSSATYIGSQVFGRTNLKTIYIPSTVTTIESNSSTSGAFYGASYDVRIYCGKSSAPSGYGTYWNTYNWYTSEGVVHNSKLSVYYNYTYSQYQSATGNI